ncbi:MAG: type II secretion system F family protein [Alphaproteobacteria bacterium]
MSADFVAILAAVLLFVAGYSLYLRINAGKRRKLVGARMVELTDVGAQTKEEPAVDTDDLFRQLEEERQKGFVGGVKRWLSRVLRPVGGLKALKFVLLIALVSGAASVLIGLKALSLPPMLNVFVALLTAYFVPSTYIKMKADKRRQQFLDSFPDAIDLVVRAVKAGIPTSESIATAGRELPDPLGGEFARIAQEVAIGVPPNKALSDAAERVGINDFNFFAVTLMLQRETGGNLAETLDNLSALLRKRKEMRLKVKALTAEGKFTSKVIGGLPVLVVTALYFLNRGYVTLLFTDDVAQIFLGIAVSLVIIGSIIMSRLVNLEV